MMNKFTKPLLVLFCMIPFYGNQLFAVNNSIAFYFGYGPNCTYQFRDTIGTRTFTPTSFFWDFGDGNTSTSQHAAHDYLSNGNYTVKHIISNGSSYDTAILSIKVDCNANKPLKADFTYTYEDSNATARFSDRSNGRIFRYWWSFGDGDTANGDYQTHQYIISSASSFNVCLVVMDGSASFDTACQTIYVKPIDSCFTFRAYFGWQRDTTCRQMQFFNQSHYTATSYSWDFGDGTTSTSANPTHLYSLEQSYQVKLKVASSKCSDSITNWVEVRCRSCYSVDANISLDIDSANPSKAVLYNYSTGAFGSHFWDFGDGDTSTLLAPNHVYTNPGNIHLVYIVTDTLNCSDTASIDFVIDSLGHIKRGNISFSLQVINKTNTWTSVKETEKNSNSLKVYPIPASDQISIENSVSTDVKFSIYDASGRLIEQQTIDSGSVTQIDTSQWQAGLYLIRDDLGKIQKLIIQH